ncbi:RES domain-containing protein (plasmid) [Cereibacter azotoformans]|uniref:RES domain-containing protein n=1 Tax=Cereibacter azotoformans TaxID=43057 RepID=UPI001EEA172B|nr:RES domain-containing protein [Cereibacter azotoformans]ULB12587.1 RES domain-containing protein [Cereibacter azotoformans]
MKLGDVAEQDILKAILDETKPPVREECRNLGYLLSAPFRYPPYPHGSRFSRTGLTAGVWYGAEAPEKAIAEMAFYRFLFYARAPRPPFPIARGKIAHRDSPGYRTFSLTRTGCCQHSDAATSISEGMVAEVCAILRVIIAGVIASTLLSTPSAASACSDLNTPDFFKRKGAEEISQCLTGWNVMQTDAAGLSPLMTAVTHGDVEDVIAILAFASYEEMPEDKPTLLEQVLSQRDRRGRSALHLAALEATDPRIIVQLAVYGVDVFAEFGGGDGWLDSGQTPLHLAASRPEGAQILAALLAVGASDTADQNGRTAQSLARSLGSGLVLVS